MKYNTVFIILEFYIYDTIATIRSEGEHKVYTPTHISNSNYYNNFIWEFFFAIFMFHIKMTTLHRRDKVLVQLPPATIFPYIQMYTYKCKSNRSNCM